MTEAHNPLLARLDNEPVMIAETCGQQVASMLVAAASHPRFDEIMESASNEDNYWPAADDWRATYRPYVVKDGILQIPVKGVLLHDFAWQLGGWATGYDYIYRAFKRGMEDSEVRGIALVVHSPGGMVAGCFDMVDKLVALKEEHKKPVRAYAQEYAYSAAYATIMVADEGGINVSRTGGVGSIGVVTMHVDYSKALESDGVKVTFIHAGKYKVEGNPYEALSDEAKARIQERIDELYQVFVSAVARGRNMDEQAVRDTEALCYTATQAISNGLADNIGSLDDALATFVADLSSNDGEETMSQTTDTSAEQNTADAAAATAAAVQAAKDEARREERQRVGAITGSEEAEGRTELAHHLAHETDMSVEAAVAVLKKSPKAAAPATDDDEQDDENASTETPFDKAMSQDNPGVGASGGGQSNSDNDDDGSASLELARAVGLGCVKPAKAA